MADLILEIFFASFADTDKPSQNQSIATQISSNPHHNLNLYNEIMNVLISNNIIAEHNAREPRTRSGFQRQFARPDSPHRVGVSIFLRSHKSLTVLDPTDAVLTHHRIQSLFFASHTRHGVLPVFVHISNTKLAHHKRTSTARIRELLAHACPTLIDIFYDVSVNETLRLRRKQIVVSSTAMKGRVNFRNIILKSISHAVQKSATYGHNTYNDVSASAKHPFTLEPVYLNRRLNTVDYACNAMSANDLRDLVGHSNGLITVYVVRQYADVSLRPQDVCYIGTEDIDIDLSSNESILALLSRHREHTSQENTHVSQPLLQPTGSTPVSHITVGISFDSSHVKRTLTLTDFTSGVNLVQLAKAAFPNLSAIPTEDFVIAHMNSSLEISISKAPFTLTPDEAHKVYHAPDASFEFAIFNVPENIIPTAIAIPPHLHDFHMRSIKYADVPPITVVDYFNTSLIDVA
jgi:hypothetical protein